MSILDKTQKLNLTQFTGDISSFANIYSRYNRDMLIIDNWVDVVETRVDTLDTLVTSYESRVSTLEDCCSDVNTTLLNYGSRLVEIERVIDTVSTANIDDLTERINALENKVETNITNIGILRHDLHEAIDRIDVAENTLVEHGTQLTNHENRISNIERCCDEVHGELTRIESKVDTNKSEIDALKQRVTTNEGNISANAQDITILSGQVAVNTADIEDLKQGLAELDPTSQLEVVRQVSINTENIASLQSSVNAQATSLTNVTTRVANAEDDIVDLKADNLTLHSEIAQVQGWDARITQAENKAQQASDDVTQIQLSISELSSSLLGVDARLGVAEIDIGVLQSKTIEYDSKIATDEAALTALTNRVSANESDLTTIHQTITNDEAGLSTVSGKVTALESQNGNTPLNTVAQTLSGGVNEVNTKVTDADSKATQALSLITGIKNALHPVGSVYLTIGNTDPATLLGFGVWSLLSDGYLRTGGSDATGGSMTSGSHAITIAEMPSHSHTIAHTHDWSNTHNHGITDPGHSHSHVAGTSFGNRGGDYNTVPVGRSEATGSSTTGITINNKTISGTTGAASNGNSGSSGSGNGHTHSIEPTFTRVYAWERTS